MMCNSIRPEELKNYIDKGYIGESKIDGARIIYREGKLFTQDRNSYSDSRDVTYKFPDLQHTPIKAVLDGEIVAEDGTFESTGSRIQTEDKLAIRILSKKLPAIYNVFDILEVNGEDVTGLSLMQRKELLKSIKFDNPRIKLLEWTENLEELWSKIVDNKGEGIILKNKDGHYEATRRSWNFIKCKNWSEEIFITRKYDENPKGIAIYLENGQRVQASGYNSPPLKEAIDKYGSARVEIQYLSKQQKAGSTKENDWILRFPSFKRFI